MDIIKTMLAQISDRWQQEYQQQVQQQQARAAAEKAYMKYQQSLQLQAELFEIFSQVSAPATLRQIKYPSDLVSTNFADADNIFRFCWAKQNNEKLPLAILNPLTKKFNGVILAYRQRLLNTPNDPCWLVQAYPFTMNGFIVIGCLDRILDLELVIQT